jgi:hypothetical protein
MKINDLQDKYSGQIGFVVGSGPSLSFIKKDELLKIRNYPIICVNSAILKFANLGCKNLYFLSDDIAVKNWSYFQLDLPKIKNCTYLLFEDKLKNEVKHLDQDRIVWFKHKCWYDPHAKVYHPEGLELTRKATDPIIGARTSSGSGIHFMSCIFNAKTTVLLGTDCSYHQNKRYYWQFKGEKKAFRLDNIPVYSVPNKGIRDGQPIDNHSLDFIHYFEALSKQCEKQNIKVLNASGGILKCFERVKLEDIFK